MTAHSLTYDNLPAHSRLQREYVDGVLKIIAGPEEPGPLVRRWALRCAAVSAAMICCATLVVGAAVFGSTYQEHRRYMSSGLSIALFVAFVVFCAALFALVWRIQYASRIDAAQKALQQTTILAASKDRLIIETRGPLGAASHDLKRDSLRTTIGWVRVAAAKDQLGVGVLEVILPHGGPIRIFPGRDEVELNWIAATVVSAILEPS